MVAACWIETTDQTNPKPRVEVRSVAADTVIRAALLNRPVRKNHIVVTDVVDLALKCRRPLGMVFRVNLFKPIRVDRHAVQLARRH